MDLKASDGVTSSISMSGILLPLNEVRDGWKVEVVAYRRNGRVSRRLAELGLTPGTPIRILRCSQSQPLLLCVRGTHLAIDQSTAASVSVRVIHGERRRGRSLRGWGRRKRRSEQRGECSAE